MSEIVNFRISSLSEGCVNIENVSNSFIVDFDRFRKEFREKAFSSLRSVDFLIFFQKTGIVKLFLNLRSERDL
jgi:hypothetical protein